MKKLTSTQNLIMNDWINAAEKSNFTPSEIKTMDEKLSAVLQSLEYVKPIYFPRKETLK